MKTKRYEPVIKNTKSDGLSILGLLLLICFNVFVNNILRKVRDKWPKAGMFVQSSPVSIALGLGFGYLVYKFQGQDIAVKLRKSFEPLFMNFFLPFIINDGAVNAFPKKSFFKNIVPVLIFAIFGTAIAIVLTSMMFKAITSFEIIKQVTFHKTSNFLFSTASSFQASYLQQIPLQSFPSSRK